MHASAHRVHNHIDDAPSDAILLELAKAPPPGHVESVETVETHLNIRQDIEHQDHPHPVGDVADYRYLATLNIVAYD